MKRTASIVWMIGLLAALGYAALASRGTVRIANPIGGLLPHDAASQPFKFAVVGDTHCHRRSLRDAIQKVTDAGCEFLVHTGDFVDYDDAHEYRWFVRDATRWAGAMPIYLVRGNHESMTPGGGFSDNYLAFTERAGFCFEHRGALFCLLDDSSGNIDTNQRLAIQGRVTEFRTANPAGPVFPFLHIPPDLTGFDSPDMSDEASAWLAGVSRQCGITAVFAGHVHDFVEQNADDVRLVVNGCGGGSIRYPSTKSQIMVVNVDGGRITIQPVPIARDNRCAAAIVYFGRVLVPRHRGPFIACILLLMLREALWYRRHRRPVPRPAAPPAPAGDSQ